MVVVSGVGAGDAGVEDAGGEGAGSGFDGLGSGLDVPGFALEGVLAGRFVSSSPVGFSLRGDAPGRGDEGGLPARRAGGGRVRGPGNREEITRCVRVRASGRRSGGIPARARRSGRNAPA